MCRNLYTFKSIYGHTRIRTHVSFVVKNCKQKLLFLISNKKIIVFVDACVMKRSATMDQQLTYETAIKKAQLVERNPQLQLDPLRVSMHEETDIIKLAQEIQAADKQLKNSTSQKLVVILDQIKMLQAQAMNILQESNDSRALHSAACNFTKKPGHIYHLYQRATGQNYFSMLSPEEWNHPADQTFKGSYRLEYDLSWTPVDKIREHDDKLKWVERCMNSESSATAAIDFNMADS